MRLALGPLPTLYGVAAIGLGSVCLVLCDRGYCDLELGFIFALSLTTATLAAVGLAAQRKRLGARVMMALVAGLFLISVVNEYEVRDGRSQCVYRQTIWNPWQYLGICVLWH